MKFKGRRKSRTQSTLKPLKSKLITTQSKSNPSNKERTGKIAKAN